MNPLSMSNLDSGLCGCGVFMSMLQNIPFSCQDYFERVGLFSSKFTQSMWLSFGAFRWILLLVIGIGAGLVPVLQVIKTISARTCSAQASQWLKMCEIV